MNFSYSILFLGLSMSFHYSILVLGLSVSMSVPSSPILRSGTDVENPSFFKSTRNTVFRPKVNLSVSSHLSVVLSSHHLSGHDHLSTSLSDDNHLRSARSSSVPLTRSSSVVLILPCDCQDLPEKRTRSGRDKIRLVNRSEETDRL